MTKDESWITSLARIEMIASGAVVLGVLAGFLLCAFNFETNSLSNAFSQQGSG